MQKKELTLPLIIDDEIAFERLVDENLQVKFVLTAKKDYFVLILQKADRVLAEIRIHLNTYPLFLIKMQNLSVIAFRNLVESWNPDGKAMISVFDLMIKESNATQNKQSCHFYRLPHVLFREIASYLDHKSLSVFKQTGFKCARGASAIDARLLERKITMEKIYKNYQDFYTNLTIKSDLNFENEFKPFIKDLLDENLDEVAVERIFKGAASWQQGQIFMNMLLSFQNLCNQTHHKGSDLYLLAQMDSVKKTETDFSQFADLFNILLQIEEPFTLLLFSQCYAYKKCNKLALIAISNLSLEHKTMLFHFYKNNNEINFLEIIHNIDFLFNIQSLKNVLSNNLDFAITDKHFGTIEQFFAKQNPSQKKRDNMELMQLALGAYLSELTKNPMRLERLLTDLIMQQTEYPAEVSKLITFLLLKNTVKLDTIQAIEKAVASKNFKVMRTQYNKRTQSCNKSMFRESNENLLQKFALINQYLANILDTYKSIKEQQKSKLNKKQMIRMEDFIAKSKQLIATVDAHYADTLLELGWMIYQELTCALKCKLKQLTPIDLNQQKKLTKFNYARLLGILLEFIINDKVIINKQSIYQIAPELTLFYIKMKNILDSYQPTVYKQPEENKKTVNVPKSNIASNSF